MEHIETDYLVVGGGASGLAFADTLLEQTDATITIVDRHGRAGGHWNDAYPFVALHQPSAFYGVASTALGSGRIDVAGPNAGFHELASGPELSGYFDRVLRERLLASGRVDWRPMSEWRWDGTFVSRLSGAACAVTARRKVVDARYLSPTVPSTHVPGFAIAPGARVVPPNALADPARLAEGVPPRWAILGGGKTAMDAATWLLDNGVAPDAITWVVPRDSWLLNRLHTQPGEAFFEHSIGGQADQLEACAQATSVDDLFERLEARGIVMRIDPTRRPTMCHLATISEGEVRALRRIRDVVRMGRVRAVRADGLELDGGRVALPPGTVCVDCTASAVERRPLQPIFQGGRIVLQLVRLPAPTFSAALCAWVEANVDDDAARNRLCGTVPFPHTLADYAAAQLAHLRNQATWSREPALRAWIRDCRLDGFGRLVAGVAPGDAGREAIVARLRSAIPAAMTNLATLAANGAVPPATRAAPDAPA